MVSEVKYAAKLLGESCGKHGTYTFFPGIFFTHKNKSRTIKLGEAFFLSLPVLSESEDNLESVENNHENVTNTTTNEQIETNTETLPKKSLENPTITDTSNRKRANKDLIKYFQVLGELQLVWKDKNHEEEELVSVKIYLKPQDTPAGRLSFHGKDELVTVETKVVLRLTELVGHIIKTESLHHRHYHYLQRIHYRHKQLYHQKRHHFTANNTNPLNTQIKTEFKNGINKALKSICVVLKEKSNVFENLTNDYKTNHSNNDDRVTGNKAEPSIGFISKIDGYHCGTDAKDGRKFMNEAGDGSLCVLKDETLESKENKLVLNHHPEASIESSTNKIKHESKKTDENSCDGHKASHKSVSIPCRHNMKKPMVLAYSQYCRLKTAFKRIETMFDFENLHKTPCQFDKKYNEVKSEDSANENKESTKSEKINKQTTLEEAPKAQNNVEKIVVTCKETLLHHYIAYLMGSTFMTSLPDTFTNVQFFFSREIVTNADHLNIIKNDLSHLAPRLKGRKRKKKSYSRYFESDDSNESEFFNDYIITRNSNHNLNNNTNSNSSCNSNRSCSSRNSPNMASLSIQKTPPMKKKKIETDRSVENGKNKEMFLKHLHSFMEDNLSPISKNPTLGFKEVDLYQLYTSTQARGGYELVTKKKLWKDVYDDLGGASGNTSAATVTRKHYERYLQPFENHLKSGSTNLSKPSTSPNQQNTRVKRLVRSRNEADKSTAKNQSESSPMLKLHFNKEAFIVIRPAPPQDQDQAKSVEFSKADEVQMTDKVDENLNSHSREFATSASFLENTTETSEEALQFASAANNNACLKQSQNILQAPSSKLPIKNFFKESTSQAGNRTQMYSGKRTRSKKIFQLIQPASKDINSNFDNANKIDTIQNYQNNSDNNNASLELNTTTGHSTCSRDMLSGGSTVFTCAKRSSSSYKKNDDMVNTKSLDSIMESSSNLPCYNSSDTFPLLTCNTTTSAVDNLKNRCVNGFLKANSPEAIIPSAQNNAIVGVSVASHITKIPKKVENLMNCNDTASLNSHSFYQNNVQNIKNRSKNQLLNNSFNQKPISSYLDLYTNRQDDDMPADMSMKTLNKLQETINNLQNEPLDLSTPKKSRVPEPTCSTKSINCNYLPIDLTKTNSSNDYFSTNFQEFPTSNYPPSSLPLLLPSASQPTLPIDLTQLLLTVQINSSGTPILSSIQQNINMIYNPGPISFPIVNSTSLTPARAINNNATNYP